MDFSLLSISDPTQSRTSKAAYVTQNGGSALWTLPDMIPAFEPQGFDGKETDRMTLCLRVPPQIAPQIQALDDWFCVYAAEHSERLLSRKMDLAAVKELYTSPIKVHEKYGTSLRVKYTANGAQATRFWTPDRNRRDAPTSWRDCSIASMLQIRSVWYLGRNLGLTLTLNDARVDERIVESPW